MAFDKTRIGLAGVTIAVVATFDAVTFDDEGNTTLFASRPGDIGGTGR
jgi:hypothetical protein